MINHKYTKSDIKYLKDNLLTNGLKGCAEHLGVSVPALKKKLTSIRKNEAMPDLRVLNVVNLPRMRDGLKKKNEFKRFKSKYTQTDIRVTEHFSALIKKPVKQMHTRDAIQPHKRAVFIPEFRMTVWADNTKTDDEVRNFWHKTRKDNLHQLVKSYCNK